MPGQLLRYADHWLTDDERSQVNSIVQQAIDRLVAKRDRNGVCACRCKWPLEDDGTNTCGCCNQPQLEYLDD